MQIPARGGLAALVQAFAKDPETVPLIVFETIIIPCQRPGMFPPPFRRDALRPFGQDDIVPDPPPDELCRGAIGNSRRGFNLFRRLEQPDRALGRLARGLSGRPFDRQICGGVNSRFQ